MTSPNATILTRMNTLKQAASGELLTDAQEAALTAIKDHREDDAKFINLHGPQHAGKTFLCWVLQQDSDWAYYQALPDNANTPTTIYDHGNPDRRATRKLRNHASINGLATIVYVTERPAEEVYPRVELSPAEEHYSEIASNWADLGLDLDTAPSPIQQ